MHVLPKKMLRRCYVLADVIIFVYEVAYFGIILMLTKSNHSQKIITKCDGIITNCDSLVYYKVRWTVITEIATAFLIQSATRFITNYDRYYKVRCIYYKLRQVLQSAMIITNCDSTGSISITSVTISSSWESLMAASLWRQTVELLTTTSRTTKKEAPITKPTVETTRIFGEKSAPSEDDNFAFLGASCDCGWDFTFVVLLLSPIRREDTDQITITRALLTSSRYNSSSFRIHSNTR